MPEDRTQSLRIELKTWEKEFTATNGGKRPGREDIKNNAEIGMQMPRHHEQGQYTNTHSLTAAKYREYDKLRRPSTKQSEPLPTATQHATPKKAVFAATPQKPTSHFLLPNLQLQPQPDEDEEPEPTPAAIRMHLGPTPQRDGQLLSLFDDLPSTTTKPSRAALKSIGANATNFTPSKPSQPIFTSPLENPYNRTPASSSKRFLLDSYISTTPLKRKRDDQDADAHATPSSSAKGLSTPAFLRRSSNKLIMDTLVEEAENDDHAIKSLNLRGRITQPPFKKRGMVRSLSSLIQGLRQQEDDQLDEQLEMMREMEVGVPTQQQSSVQVQDSQVVMPLGPDRGFESEESEEDAQQQTGIFRKPWKKKGLKRQTKRVISKFFFAPP
jgi:DNA replication regulator SLD2